MIHSPFAVLHPPPPPPTRQSLPPPLTILPSHSVQLILHSQPPPLFFSSHPLRSNPSLPSLPSLPPPLLRSPAPDTSLLPPSSLSAPSSAPDLLPLFPLPLVSSLPSLLLLPFPSFLSHGAYAVVAVGGAVAGGGDSDGVICSRHRGPGRDQRPDWGRDLREIFYSLPGDVEYPWSSATKVNIVYHSTPVTKLPGHSGDHHRWQRTAHLHR